MPENTNEELHQAHETIRQYGKEEDLDRIKKTSVLMGNLYGVLSGFAMLNMPINYAEVQQMMQNYCTPEELKAVAQEVKRYSQLVDGLL